MVYRKSGSCSKGSGERLKLRPRPPALCTRGHVIGVTMQFRFWITPYLKSLQNSAVRHCKIGAHCRSEIALFLKINDLGKDGAQGRATSN